MTPERWKQIRSVFEEAELLGLSDRLPFLDQACAGDSELRIEVESLLKARFGKKESVVRLQPIFDAEDEVKGYMAYTRTQ